MSKATKAAKRPRVETPPSPTDTSALIPVIRRLLDAQMEKFESRFKNFESSLFTKIKELDNDLNDIRAMLEFQSHETDQLKVKMADMETNFKRKDEELREEVDRLATYVARENLVILGLKEVKDENLSSELSKLYKDKLKMEDDVIQRIEYQRVHRVAAAGGGPRPIKARFTRYADKLLVQKNAKLLKGSDIYLADDLPKHVRELRRVQVPTLKAAQSAGKLAFFGRAEPTKLFVDHVLVPIGEQKSLINKLEKSAIGVQVKVGHTAAINVRDNKENEETKLTEQAEGNVLRNREEQRETNVTGNPIRGAEAPIEVMDTRM
ncbi:uncharacterized protein LOC105438869 isoform X1 [Strongylocentrotus purpuratus]|uniref:Uncharacterized protein n=1 Tax=Strongylocentrotus purpuratus TaxID=7668 RepID=A0A7M7T5H8_STRPU|nr:uncharacterized protein LOC105438869 isoform X1 [Strongylocentrotus purpuratus]XP_030855414.1 uncharacterized protein LOC105438869 isoform X1 [Strongylocentrotus purpuratus]